jgi:hypothetical protein
MCALIFALATELNGVQPWWILRDVVKVDQPSDDFAMANLGQLKNFAHSAMDEMNATFTLGAGAEIQALIDSWNMTTSGSDTADDYAAANLGQLYHTVAPFYLRLLELGAIDSTPPWLSETQNVDFYAGITIGQLKKLFDIPFADLAASLQAQSGSDAEPMGEPDSSDDSVLASIMAQSPPAPIALDDQSRFSLAGRNPADSTSWQQLGYDKINRLRVVGASLSQPDGSSSASVQNFTLDSDGNILLAN